MRNEKCCLGDMLSSFFLSSVSAAFVNSFSLEISLKVLHLIKGIITIRKDIEFPRLRVSRKVLLAAASHQIYIK